MEKKNYLYISILKIIACFLVIVNHTNSVIFLQNQGNYLWFTSITTFFISKIAVPIFMLVSGALLLGKDYDYKTILKKTAKFVLILILISLAYYLFGYIRFKDSISLSDFFVRLYNCNIRTHLWYVYYYIGFLLTLPILQKLTKSLKKEDYVFLFIISLGICGGVLLFAPHFINNINYHDFYFYFFTSYITLPLIGYYLHNMLEVKNKKRVIIIASLISIICVAINVVLAYIEYVKGGYYLYLDNINFITISLPAICVFIIIKIVVENKDSKIIKHIASTTFLIYLMHIGVMDCTQRVQIALTSIMNEQIAIYIYEILLFIFCSLIATIILKLPIIKKLFN